MLRFVGRFGEVRADGSLRFCSRIHVFFIFVH